MPTEFNWSPPNTGVASVAQRAANDHLRIVSYKSKPFRGLLREDH